MKGIIISILFSTSVMFIACGGRSGSSSDNDVNPRDTVKVPEGYTGEDSIAYIENAVLKSNITAEDLLGLAEVHSVEDRLFDYNNEQKTLDNPEYAKEHMVTHRDCSALRLINRIMRMNELVKQNGKANDKLQWAIAVNAAIDTFLVEEPTICKDQAFEEIERVTSKFSSDTQTEMNYISYIDATLDYYRTIEAYRQWLQAVPKDIRALAQEEYEAWHDLNDARFNLWNDVSYCREWYSMKPLEIEGYYSNLSENRRAELDVERDIILNGKLYKQKGETVTAKEWERWIADNSVPEDLDMLEKNDTRIPSDSIVTDRVNTLKTTFAKWLKARQDLAAALPKEQGDSYDYLTADMHSRMTGKLEAIIPYDYY